MSTDFQRIEQSKKALAQRLAALPIEEKLRLLDAMRERALMLAASRPISDDSQVNRMNGVDDV